MAKNEKTVTDPHACTLDKIISLCKRRGFVYQASEIYGGQAGAWDYGPLGGRRLKTRRRLCESISSGTFRTLGGRR